MSNMTKSSMLTKGGGFPCADCRKCFPNNTSLQQHRLSKHPAPLKTAATLPASSANIFPNVGGRFSRVALEPLLKTSVHQCPTAKRVLLKPAAKPLPSGNRNTGTPSPNAAPSKVLDRARSRLSGVTSSLNRLSSPHTSEPVGWNRKVGAPEPSASISKVVANPLKSSSKKVACPGCSKWFSTMTSLRQHQVNKPEGHIRPSRDTGSSICEACSSDLKNQDALEQHFAEEHSVIQLRSGESTRVDVEREFRENWRKKTRCGNVQNVFQLYNTAWRHSKFEQYRKLLKVHRGNEVMRYHGTSLLCNLGTPEQKSKLCQNDDCNFCSILRQGFKKNKARTDTWQRFGRGIYVTATSSKSDDYVKMMASSRRRAVLVCRVLAGKVYSTQKNMLGLESPPKGYNSISGEVGKDLNFDELVVYDSNAILPAYMIVYSIDD